jgi:hypothetical protein
MSRIYHTETETLRRFSIDERDGTAQPRLSLQQASDRQSITITLKITNESKKSIRTDRPGYRPSEKLYS